MQPWERSHLRRSAPSGRRSRCTCRRSRRTTGAYGAVGLVGALAAPLVGKSAEARGDRRINAIATLAILASFAVLWSSGDSLWGLGAGCILLDFGVQANHISNQTRI